MINFKGIKVHNLAAQRTTITVFFIILALYYLVGMHILWPHRGGYGLWLPHNNITWCVIIGLTSLGLWRLSNGGSLYYSRWLAISALATLVLLLPLALPQAAPHLALPRLLGLVAGLAFLTALYQLPLDQQRRQGLLILLLSSGMIEGLLAHYQYWIIYPDAVANSADGRVSSAIAYGHFFQRNVFGSYMAMSSLLGAYLIITYTTRSVWVKRFFYACVYVCASQAVMSQSRTAWLGLLLGSIILYVAQPQQRRWLWAIVLGAISGILALSYADYVAIRSLENLTDSSGSRRSYIFYISLQLWLNTPWLGVGYGNFEYSYLQQQAAIYAQQGIFGHHNLGHPHNEILYWLAEGGAIIGLLLVALYSLFTLQLLRAKRAGGIWLAVFTPLLLHSLLEYPFYSSSAHWLGFLLLIYCCDRQLNPRYDITLPRLRPLKLMLPFTCITVWAFMLTSLQSGLVLTRYETEEPPNPALLSQVTNPLMTQSHLSFYLMQYRSFIDINLGQTDSLASYVLWAEEYVKETPRSAIYIRWIESLIALGRIHEAQALSQTVAYLYPKDMKVEAFMQRHKQLLTRR